MLPARGAHGQPTVVGKREDLSGRRANKKKSGPRGGDTRAAGGELLFGAEIIGYRKDSGNVIRGHEGELTIGVIKHYAIEGDMPVLHNDANGGLHALKVFAERGSTQQGAQRMHADLVIEGGKR